ncbi:hypothetical protein HRJ34_14755 [Rhizorhabdus wittichii]|uniref:Uncharacterized protein n=1 Tax=Rhizorhabdus wittichii TaxID=160791 RepID=A0A975HBQ4_9SPHN|nr:hypothetical protein [Rhizorhabdus wittichii]QTH19635.1 hypothetical protein HRJ34_14755 [Rhizorhabdus wittichii]
MQQHWPYEGEPHPRGPSLASRTASIFGSIAWAVLVILVVGLIDLYLHLGLDFVAGVLSTIAIYRSLARDRRRGRL